MNEIVDAISDFVDGNGEDLEKLIKVSVANGNKTIYVENVIFAGKPFGPFTHTLSDIEFASMANPADLEVNELLTPLKNKLTEQKNSFKNLSGPGLIENLCSATLAGICEIVASEADKQKE